MKWQILCGFLLYFPFLCAIEFLYPVAAHTNGLFYLIYQKTPHHIELWEWDCQTKEADQLLFSRFTPAGFRLLPTGDGFSFIDNGVLKVKKFLKRSPRIIEFDAPIYQVEIVHWLDDTVCYTSGKYQNYFGIFQIDYEGEVIPLYVKESVDCMYPQKINDSLFYIERDEQWHCRIMQTLYALAEGDSFNQRLAWHYAHRPIAHEIVAFEKPVVFLAMISEEEGYMVSHPPMIHKTDVMVTFEYYHLKRTASQWQLARLFSFDIPADFLFIGSASRLYESILPLLPQHYGNTIIFSSLDASQKLSLFLYDHAQHTVTQLPNSHGLFPPIARMSGGELHGNVGMGISETGAVTAELVKIFE